MYFLIYLRLQNDRRTVLDDYFGFIVLAGKLGNFEFMNTVNDELGSMHSFTWKG
jgi:hypothetical protein